MTSFTFVSPLLLFLEALEIVQHVVDQPSANEIGRLVEILILVDILLLNLLIKHVSSPFQLVIFRVLGEEVVNPEKLEDVRLHIPGVLSAVYEIKGMNGLCLMVAVIIFVTDKVSFRELVHSLVEIGVEQHFLGSWAVRL